MAFQALTNLAAVDEYFLPCNNVCLPSQMPVWVVEQKTVYVEGSQGRGYFWLLGVIDVTFLMGIYVFSNSYWGDYSEQ